MKPIRKRISKPFLAIIILIPITILILFNIIVSVYAKTKVTISLKQIDEKSVIALSDDGDGIKNVDTVFDRFYKGENGNFGLGLSIAKTSVKMMNGEIKVYNEDGAVFEVVLPNEI